MKFSIPMKRDDLLQPPDDETEFFVRDVYSIRELKTKIKDCEMGLKQSGCEFILKGGFEILFSVLVHFNKDLPVECKETAFEILQYAISTFEKDLDNILGPESQALSSSEKEKMVNQMKMIIYLFCQMMEMFESSDMAGGAEMIFAKMNKTGRKGKNNPGGKMQFWESDVKLVAITQLFKLCHFNIALLFDPPVVEREFVNAIGNTLFRFFENPSIAHQKNRDLRVSIIQVLGTLCERFSYSLSCRLKIVQSLRHFEHIAVPMSEAADIITNEFNNNSIIMEIIRDLSQIDSQELQRDTTATRAYATFLGDLAERQPAKMKSSLSLLMVHLDAESYSMRKCVLSILGEIVLNNRNLEELDEAAKESRDQFLDCLEDHVHDVHAFVRTSVLQVWSKLSVANVIPLSRHHRLLNLVIGRLQDKSSNVRKQSVQLLTTLLEQNPYGAQMPVEDLMKQLEEEREKLNVMMPKRDLTIEKREKEWAEFEGEVLKEPEDETSDVDSQEAVWENATRDEVLARLRHLLEKKKFIRVQSLVKSARLTFPEDDLLGENTEKETLEILKAVYVTPSESAEEIVNQNEGVKKQQTFVGYLQDCVNFAQALDKAIPTVCNLLSSKTMSDIKEAVKFFVSAQEFGVHKAMDGVRQMLTLIWSREKEIKDEVVNAYKELYIEDKNQPNKKGQAAFIVKNFVAWVNGATIGELTSLEELISMLVATGDIGKECFQILWQYFTKGKDDISDDEARSAVVILAMIGNAEPSVIRANLELLIKFGLKGGESDDFRMVYEVCVALTKISGLKSSKPEEPPLRFEMDHEIFVALKKMLVKGIEDPKDLYIPMSKMACAVIYQYSETPDILCGEVLKEICSKVQSGKDVSSVFVKRLVSFVGHLAIYQLNYLDVSVMNELKRRKLVRDLKKEKSKTKNARKSSLSRRQSKVPNNEEVDEMELIGAEADDTEIEFIRNVCETEVLCGTNLLNVFSPLVLNICRQPGRYTDPQLRVAASLALAKMMLLSSQFCDEHLQLLFTLMEKGEDSVMRANLIIATGDLSFRFPNTLEPWTPRMYARLRDDSTLVRSNTLTVLTHLILNDMIKVKGQISDMALCISDQDTKISGLSKHFFSELSRKGNALYNVMPDIISRLSNADSKVPEDQFRSIMNYIIGLIEKDKHLESLVDKLCHRFRVTPSMRQWRDISYCLSLFTFNERAVKKLQDNFGCYSDKLHDDDVYNAFSGILVHARKQVKVETRNIIDEFEQKLEESRAKCLEDFKAQKRADKGGRRDTIIPPPEEKDGEDTKVGEEKAGETGQENQIEEEAEKDGNKEEEEKTAEELETITHQSPTKVSRKSVETPKTNSVQRRSKRKRT